MASTRPINEENLGESWVEVTDPPISPVPSERVQPQGIGPEDYLKLLREAQRESNQSSALVSLASTRKNSPHSSPKSPPNSPNTEPSVDGEDFKGLYINYYTKDEAANLENNTDWVWDWSSRPDQQPPKEWKFSHPDVKQNQRKPYGYSIRCAKVGGTSVFSREVIYTMVITNLISLLLGTGIGVFLSRRGCQVLPISLE